MKRFRIIPSLLIDNEELVKGKQFQNHRYIGDPINAVKIFNEKDVDELCLLDISATRDSIEPNYSLIEEIASEAFMPISYGGGITDINQVSKILKIGVEKVIFNSSALFNSKIIEETAQKFGSSSTVVSIDVTLAGQYQIKSNNGKNYVSEELVPFLKKMEKLGTGELLITSIEKEGSYNGYDLELIKIISDNIGIPFIINGGAGKAEHFKQAIDAGASAVAASSMFVFYGNLEGVLITYPV